eukprot:TRINITY_DN6044_c0_g2_i1.p1 TRINITY_DN6044_c0_g2~~TRINITY_DN6044_c0_g2_i1.p1  ORF type:complete len:232 (+),score=42.09 TRINITY_DN6044_c0_g2_i1:116-811(+)
MFDLAHIEDDVPVRPLFFGDWEVQLKREIQSRYVDRVIPNVGLCVEFYSFVKIGDAIVHPGDKGSLDGAAWFKVEFQLVVFRPRVGEWLVGSISSSSTLGLRVSLGFFRDITIPSANLRAPYVYDAARQCWAWQYYCMDTRETVNFFYELDQLIRFRVTAIEFPSEDGQSSGGAAKTTNAIRLVGAVDRDGLGCVCWWPSAAPAAPALEAPTVPAAGGEAEPTGAADGEAK